MAKTLTRKVFSPFNFSFNFLSVLKTENFSQLANTSKNEIKEPVYEPYRQTGRRVEPSEAGSEYNSTKNKLQRVLLVLAALIFGGISAYGIYALIAHFTG